MNHILTDREQRVMDLIIEGKSNNEIAVELEVSVNTIKTHLRHVFRKLEVENRTQASVRYLRLSK
ncbi:MAG: response regulator transcription factor [Saprospiraceae bacterium]|nr:response regulator transcription factor [Saprospiraceae bacterium]